MSDPHTDPDRYEGLLEHVERHLGQVLYGQPPDAVDGRNRGFAIGFHAHPERDLVSAATTGVRFQRVAARMPEEFVLSALTGQEGEAGYLVHVVADRVVRSGRGMEYGGGYLNAEPLIPGSQISGLVAASHPFAGSQFDLFLDGAGQPVLQFISLIPITRPEYDFMQSGRTLRDLSRLFVAADVDPMDVYRPSAL